MNRKIRISLALPLLLALVLAVPTLAQGPDPDATPIPGVIPSDDQVNAIAKNMYCPVCENTPLDQCGTLACQQWREEIRDKLTEGWTEQEIYDYFALKFGDRVLAVPPREGLNWLIYILPPVLFLIGIVVLFRGFQSWRQPVESLAEDGPEASSSADGEYTNQIEQELKDRD